MYLTLEKARQLYAGAIIGEGAIIEQGAYIGKGAYIITIHSKYTCNISPSKSGVFIRMGCEIHLAQYFKDHGEALARKHGELEWWNKTGVNILKYLLMEAENYIKEGE